MKNKTRSVFVRNFHPKTSKILLLSLVVGAILILVVAIYLRYAFPFSKLSTLNSPFIIRESGSTNFPGFTLTIQGDGSGMLVYDACSSADARPQCHRSNKTFPVQTFNITDALEIVSSENFIPNIPTGKCIKSISFGTTTTITYKGQTSGDIQCIDSNDPKYLSLQKVVEEFINQASKR